VLCRPPFGAFLTVPKALNIGLELFFAITYIRGLLQNLIEALSDARHRRIGAIQIVRGQRVVRFDMASPKQISANRENAKRSCGPRTARGKAITSMNALKTGVFAKHLLLPDDNADEFGRLRLEVHREWLPVGATETSFVERLVALLWRQRRIYRAESGLFMMYRQCPEGLAGVASALARDGQDTEAFTRILRMDGAIERSMCLTIKILQRLQEERGKRAGLASESCDAGSAATTNHMSDTNGA